MYFVDLPIWSHLLFLFLSNVIGAICNLVVYPLGFELGQSYQALYDRKLQL